MEYLEKALGWLAAQPVTHVLALAGVILAISAATDAAGNAVMYRTAISIQERRPLTEWLASFGSGLLVYGVSVTLFLVLSVVGIRMGWPLGVIGAIWAVSVAIMTPIGGWLLYGQVFNDRQVLGIVIGLLALYLLFTGEGPS